MSTYITITKLKLYKIYINVTYEYQLPEFDSNYYFLLKEPYLACILYVKVQNN